MSLDIFQFIFNLSGRSAFLDALGVFVAAYMPYAMVLAFVVFVFLQKGWKRRIYLFSEAALATILARGLITEIIRFFYPYPRPLEVLPIEALITKSTAAFPSGHIAFYMALAMALYFANRKWGWTFIGLTVLMGLARIFVGVHWPTDILGGIIVGIVSALIIHRLLLPHSRQFLVMGRHQRIPN